MITWPSAWHYQIWQKNKLVIFFKVSFSLSSSCLSCSFFNTSVAKKKKCCLEIIKKTIPVLIIRHRMLKLRMIWSASHSTLLVYPKVGAWRKRLLTSLSVNMADIYLLSSEKLHNESLCATMKTWPEQCQNCPQKLNMTRISLKGRMIVNFEGTQNIENIIN